MADAAESRTLIVRNIADFTAAKGEESKFDRDEDENEQETK